MKPFYRGWAGINRFEQMAEREVWMSVGWDLFTHPRAVRTTRKELIGPKQWLYPLLRWIPITLVQIWLERLISTARWVGVDVIYCAGDDASRDLERCRVRIEEMGEVTSALRSAAQPSEKITLKTVKQYRCRFMDE